MDDPRPEVPHPLPAYNSVRQLRTDAWKSLQDAADRLGKAATREAERARLAQQAEDLLDLLNPIEHYWAFPRIHHLLELRELLAQGEYDQLRKLTAGITRTLAEDTHPTSLPAARDHEHGEQIGLWVRPAQPTFEVLVVDDMAPREEESLRQELLRLRPGGPFHP
jgi:arginine decarboxylase